MQATIIIKDSRAMGRMDVGLPTELFGCPLVLHRIYVLWVYHLYGSRVLITMMDVREKARFSSLCRVFRLSHDQGRGLPQIRGLRSTPSQHARATRTTARPSFARKLSFAGTWPCISAASLA